MPDEMDLSVLRRRFDPDPGFVDALEERVRGVLAGESDPAPVGMVETARATPSEPPTNRAPTGQRRWVPTAAACAAFVVVVGVGALTRDRGGEDVEVGTGPGRATNGSVTFSSTTGGPLWDHDVYVTPAGQSPMRVAGSDADETDEVCPAIAPSGDRLVYAAANGNFDRGYTDVRLVTLAVNENGGVRADRTIALDGLVSPPCALWSSDGRRLAFAANTVGSYNSPPEDVWIVDTRGVEIRKLGLVGATDLEWRPQTDQLAVAQGDIHLYKVKRAEKTTLHLAGAHHLSWSPAGDALVFSRFDGELMSLWVADAEGGHAQRLPSTGVAPLVLHGVGPVWSPTGDRIVYQRAYRRENHEAVVISLSKHADAWSVIDETVIDPPVTTNDARQVAWNPYSVIWSPDGTTLLYQAWGDPPEVHGIVAVPLTSPHAPQLLGTTPHLGVYSATPWLPVQSWGRKPALRTSNR